MPVRFRPVILAAIAALAVVLASVVMLERQRAGLLVEEFRLGETPVTLWRRDDAPAGPLVVVAHGYAGSRQLMQPIAIALARSGAAVATFDFQGHGRHAAPMAADIASLDGATAQLVGQSVAVARALRAWPGLAGPVALVGHSMATDIVIRAAAEIGDVAGIVAISMYSDAVTPDFPARLLIVSGAREGRLRAVALDRLGQVDADAGEGETARRGDVARRAVAAPLVGHVGVLYSATTLAETRDWIAAATGGLTPRALPSVGVWLTLLLVALVALAWPAAALLGPARPGGRAGWRVGLAALGLPALPAFLAAILVPGGALGLSAFGQLAAFFGIWGAVQLAVLWRAGMRPGPVRLGGLALLLVWGLGLFAPALDRYGAAFLPTGPRLPVMALLLAGTLPYCLADATLARAAAWPWRLASRALALAVLLAAMLAAPRLGIAFTVLPVTVLFWAVYGLAARWIAARTGPAGPGLALGLILAWSIAASTPLVAA